MAEEGGSDRRVFFLSFIFSVAGIIAAALGVPALAYLLFPPKSSRLSNWVDAGNIADLKVGQPEELTFRRLQVDGWKIKSEKATAWAVKLSENEIVAYSPSCTHLGCAYHWDPEKSEFLCPCHNSVFALDGTVVSGPAPRPLDRYEVKLEASELWLGSVHKS